MSDLDVASHTVSAGGGAILAMIVDRVIRFFTERDRREEERRIAERLASIEAKLEAMQGREEILRELGRMQGQIEMMTGALANLGRK